MSGKILLADDSPTVRNVTESLLKKRGYEVLLADDGDKALSAAKAEKPDVIFLDDRVPPMNGEQVLKEIRQSKGLKNVPVVMLLCDDDSDRREQLKQMGTDAFITKPFSPGTILEHVERLLSQQEASSIRKERSKDQDVSSGKIGTPDETEQQGPPHPEEDKNSEDALNIVQTSDLMEGLDPSMPPSEEDPAHGFEWFLHELKKETHEEKKEIRHGQKKPSRPNDKISRQGDEHTEESKTREVDEDAKGFDEFVKDLKWDMKDTGTAETPCVERSVIEDMSPSQFDRLISELKEKISRRVAEEVTKKVSLEFLENVIREEIAKVRRQSS